MSSPGVNRLDVSRLDVNSQDVSSQDVSSQDVNRRGASKPDVSMLGSPRARYAVEHVTEYAYPQPVSLSQQLIHLEPRPLPWQHCLDWQLQCEPVPSSDRREIDAFGNPLCRLDFNVPHESLRIHSHMQIEILQRSTPPPATRSASWEQVRDSLRYRAGRSLSSADLDDSRYRFRSPFVPIGMAYQRYAQTCFGAGRPLSEVAAALMRKIHREFTYDAAATHIATPLADVLRLKHGVCQDFAHLMLACLRSFDLPCRYVSGYLLTHPPAGKPRMVGADASHAWVAVYCPPLGWLEFDPTNNVMPGLEHIVLGWGRDFGDVSPLRGVILGGGNASAPDVAVTVTAVEVGIV